jgi:hypothetical protein
MELPVRDLVSWDPDGAGPESPWLIATCDGGPIMAYSGDAWFQIGLASIAVQDMITWDPDGDGPATDLLVIGGAFTTLDGIPFASIAAWDGTDWTSVGSEALDPVLALAVWDVDGDGPDAPRLVASGGGFTRTFDGTTWTKLDDSGDDGASCLVAWDEDGDGPHPPTLYATGTFDQSSESPIRYFARWTGAAWQRIGTPSQTGPSPQRLLVGDPDGPGPAPIGVVLTTSFQGRECFFWDGTTLHDYRDILQAPLYAATFADPDGDGPVGIRLVVGGGSNSGMPGWRDQTGWQILGSGLQGNALDLALWDPDGSGPLPDTVFAMGTINRGTLGGVAQLINGRWEQLGAGPGPFSDSSLPGEIALYPWKNGPSPHDGGVLIAFSKRLPLELGMPHATVPYWDGTAWGWLDPLPDQAPFAKFTSWDADGPGPITERLVAASQSGVYEHDGEQWTALTTKYDLARDIAVVWDADGDGPDLPVLISKDGFGAYYQRGLGDWTLMPASFDSSIRGLVARDPDGDGPHPPWLIAIKIDDDPAISGIELRVVRWTGTEWISLTPNFYGNPQWIQISVWDFDVAGPMEPAVLIGFDVRAAGSTQPTGLLMYANGAWTSVADVLDRSSRGWVGALLPLPRSIPDFAKGSLFIGGQFDSVNGLKSSATAVLRACEPAPCAGDIDGDGATTALDFMVLANAWGTSAGAPRSSGDLNSDGAVNVADFVILAGDFGCSEQP